jgi:hypothetical protein
MGKSTSKERIGSVWRNVLRPAFMYRERVIYTSCFALFSLFRLTRGTEECNGVVAAEFSTPLQGKQEYLDSPKNAFLKLPGDSIRA